MKIETTKSIGTLWDMYDIKTLKKGLYILSYL
jgi:hypothetical protein